MKFFRALALAALVCSCAIAQNTALMPMPKLQFANANGVPLAGGRVYTYAAGTSTPLATYADASGTPNANPIVLDGAGRASIWIGRASYKVVVKDANSVVQYTQDNVSAWPMYSAATPGPTISSADYNFALPLTTTLAAGTPVALTFARCPDGVGGSDTLHWLYIADGIFSEPVKITGGTCSSAVPNDSGTLVFTAVYSHSSYVLQSATGGLDEAAASLGGVGGTVLVPPGTYTLHALIEEPTQVMIRGAGRGSTIFQLAAHEWGAGLQWRGGQSTQCLFETAQFANGWGLSDIGFDGNAANESTYGGYLLRAWNGTNGIFSGLTLINFGNTTGAPINLLGGSADNNVIENNTVVGTGGAVGTCYGGIFVQGSYNRVANNTIVSICDDGIIFNGLESMGNTATGNTLGESPGGHVALHAEDSMDNVFSANTVTTFAVGGQVSCPDCIGPVEIHGNQFVANRFASQTNFGIQLYGLTAFGRPTETLISGNTISDSASIGIVLSGYTPSNTVVGNNVYRSGSAGIACSGNSQGVCQETTIVGNNVSRGYSDGIALAYAAGGPGHQTVNITGNMIIANQGYGVSLFAFPAFSNIVIESNTMISNTSGDIGFPAGSLTSLLNSNISRNVSDSTYNNVTWPSIKSPVIKSTTGQRYVCVDTSGNLVSSASACSGT